MEDLNMYQQNQFNQFNRNDQFSQNSTGLNISHSELRSLAGWAKFVAIIQIIGASLMCLSIFTVFINPVLIIYPVMAVIFIIMGVKLLNAAGNIRSFADTGDYYNLSDSLKGFKSYFKMNGILIIVGISLTILLVLLAIFAIGAFGSLLNEYRLRY